MKMKFMILSLTMISLLNAFDHSHKVFDKILKKYVVISGKQSFVKYKELSKDINDLDLYIREIEKISKKEYLKWSKEQKMAFLINAYNALTIKLILSEYPVKSIKDIGGFFSGPWKEKFFNLFGKKSYLDFIEHEILRKDFKDSRIHFALVCASKGCPPLKDEAFTADLLENQLNDARVNFLTDIQRNYFDKRKNEINISSIFKWFKKDFLNEETSLKKYVSKYMTNDSSLREKIISKKTDIEFIDYDWSLNDYKK